MFHKTATSLQQQATVVPHNQSSSVDIWVDRMIQILYDCQETIPQWYETITTFGQHVLRDENQSIVEVVSLH